MMDPEQKLAPENSHSGKICREVKDDPTRASGVATDDKSVADTHTDTDAEESLLQSVSDFITESVHTLKDTVSGSAGGGEEKSVLQSMGTRIANSAHSMKDTVMGGTNGKILTDPDETGEASILVHSILD
ncbi:hypothetical protein MPTK1_7g16280 [Marchantia polymorpha subsp. ruderalis]|uniref:Uncharacterized protein n=2 Tax=Marchantia polymorpha TaxID=3197 RepID=A0AAF6C0A9_MARPO|nr:hypothetical protein MARPO_0123s0010 [Marchantia polymorpha]BBN17693.1 hypothetical protein Mp_7g16280 [Marchantia polymorpha subsp. ruderalis]|eukprot:PTQ30516.1 hypothetical protein MARPO_0123s0010 [Marchantia polymorpha]